MRGLGASWLVRVDSCWPLRFCVPFIGFKVHLTPKLFSLKRIYLLFEIILQKHFWIRLNPRFSVSRRNLENCTKTPPFCFTTYPGRRLLPRKVAYLTSSHFLQDGAIRIRKVRRNAFQKGYQLLQQYPRFNGRYTVPFTGDYRAMVQ